AIAFAMKALIGLAVNEPIPEGTKLPRSHKLNQLYKQVGKLHRKIARYRGDYYHKLSAMLVASFAFLSSEELDIQSLVEKPYPIKDEVTGEFLPNGASQKAKLNRSILDTAPAKLLAMIAYKAKEA